MSNSVMDDQTNSSDKGSGERNSRYLVASVKRALELIDVFLTPPHQYGLTELSQVTSQTKNQVYRFLKTLEAHNVVNMDDETKKYSLGLRPMEWGVVAHVNAPITQVAGPLMDELARELGETIVLTTLADSASAICIDRRESDQVLQITARVGRRVPLHAGAGGKCLLAFSEQDFQDAYLNRAEGFAIFTDRTNSNRTQVREELDQIRTSGFAISDEDLDIGACSVAAPIFDAQGSIAATISVASPKSRFGATELERNSQAAVAASARISASLGYRS